MANKEIKQLGEILSLDDRALQRLLREIPKKDIAYLLLDASLEIKEKIYRCVSNHYASMLKEDIELLKGVDKTNISAAMQNFMVIYDRLV